MVITGERTVPGIWHENYWFRRHEVVYDDIATRVRGKRLLEAGSGEGYGACLLRDAGAQVTALDYDAYSVDHARAAYPGLTVVRGNLVSLPFDDAGFDTVVSLQTIEHLWDQDAFIAECHRVLRPGGDLWISTPNTLTFPPGNIYHPKELTAAELRAVVGAHFGEVELVGLFHGTRLADWERAHGPLVEAQIADEPDGWPEHVASFVQSVTCADFDIETRNLDDSLDLIAHAVRGR